MLLSLIPSVLRKNAKAFMRQWLNKLKDSFLHLLYPPHCLHCKQLISHAQPLYCDTCASLCEFINPSECCPVCFGPADDYTAESNRCLSCKGQPALLFCQMGAVFDYLGPAASLIKKLKYANQPYLAKGAGAFLAAQFQRLEWPVPDAIIPVPLSFTHWLDRGYNQSELLANSLADFLQVPVWKALKRRSGDYSQAGLTWSQRQALASKKFKLKKNYSLQDKTLLLIDDVMTTRSTLYRCAEILLEGCPSRLYALTLCRTLR